MGGKTNFPPEGIERGALLHSSLPGLPLNDRSDQAYIVAAADLDRGNDSLGVVELRRVTLPYSGALPPMWDRGHRITAEKWDGTRFVADGIGPRWAISVDGYTVGCIKPERNNNGLAAAILGLAKTYIDARIAERMGAF
jgi:hypothetical protein